MSDVFVCRYNQKKTEKSDREIADMKAKIDQLAVKVDQVKAEVEKLPKDALPKV